jgi:hypothetical protein|tara:strand:+ start:1047 stop:1625 length:579 start_codon:yes stop_codon:yes gene_type:complete
VGLKFKYLFFSFILLNSFFSFSQENDLIISDTIPTIDDVINPLAPSTAAFYSAILPGLGQAYNKKYWKIPIVYGVLGTSTGFYIYNNKQYNRYRDAFKSMRSGKPHEFDGLNGNVLLTDDALERAQTRFKEDRDLSLFITIGMYALQIVEASVDAHLKQLNTDDNLAFKPQILIDPITNQVTAGISLSYSFQ